MKALCLVNDGFGGHGGIALYIRNILNSLSLHPAFTDIVALPRVMPLKAEPLPAKVRWITDGIGGIRKYLLAVHKIMFAEGHFDFIVCGHVSLLPLALECKFFNPSARVVLFIYGIEMERPMYGWGSNWLIRQLDGIISIRGQTTRRLLRWANLDGVAEYRLENSIALERYGVKPRNEALVQKFGLDGRKVIMTLGRVVKEEQYKGFDEVIEVLPEVLNRVPDAIYLIAGGGSDLCRLNEKAKGLGVADRVVFTGTVPEEEKVDYYRLADVFAMPGTGPTFDKYPLRFVFLEAMACGIPVVGCYPEDEEEAKTDATLLAAQVDPHDKQEVIDAIVSAIALPKTIPQGLAKFGFEVFSMRLHAIVDDVMRS